jgi:hypothetical protein
MIPKSGNRFSEKIMLQHKGRQRMTKLRAWSPQPAMVRAE